MSGKINAPNLSAPSLQALRAERHQETKGSSFWNKWSNLSTGQKWGRALAWVILPVGIGFQIKANLWQAKAAAPRPVNSKVSLSEDLHDGIPLKGNVLFGITDREQARAVLEPDLNKSVSVILEDNQTYSAEMVGLPEQFAKDLNRKPNHSLQSQNGKTAVHIKPDSIAAERPAMFRDFFKREFPSDLNKADQWAVFAAKFLHQGGAAPTLTVTAKNFKYAVPSDDISYNLKMENGGNSALVEIRAQGTPNEINGIDREKSTVDNFLLMRITLGPSEEIQVLSGYSKHDLVPKQPSENSEVEDNAPVQQAANEELLTSSRASNLLQKLALGMIKPGGDAYKPLQRYKDHLAAQESPDLTAFNDAFSQLDDLDHKQSLIRELVSVIKHKEPASYSSQIEQGSELGQLLSANLEALKSQENLRAIQGMTNILNAAGIHSVNDLGKIDNRKNAAASITLLQKDIINQNFLGVGNNIFTNSYDQTGLLDDHIPSQQRSDFYRPLLQESYKKTASDAIQLKKVELDNGDLQQDDFDEFVSRQNQNLDMMLRDNLQFDLDNLNDPDKRALLRNYINTAKSNNLTATEAMQVLRGLPAYHKADGDQVKNQLREVLNNQIIPERQLDNLKSLFPPMSS
jgi:hypothetical protein